MDLREAITHKLEKLGEGDLKLTLAFVSALASLDRQAQELDELADPFAQRFIEALLRQIRDRGELPAPQVGMAEFFSQMQELGKPADPVAQRFVEALLRQIRDRGELPDPVTLRAIAALWTARAIAKAHGITDEDVLEEIQAYRASIAPSTYPSITQRSQSPGLGQ